MRTELARRDSGRNWRESTQRRKPRAEGCGRTGEDSTRTYTGVAETIPKQKRTSRTNWNKPRETVRAPNEKEKEPLETRGHNQLQDESVGCTTRRARDGHEQRPCVTGNRYSTSCHNHQVLAQLPRRQKQRSGDPCLFGIKRPAVMSSDFSSCTASSVDGGRLNAGSTATVVNGTTPNIEY